ncbi:hypothetical protein HV183_02930 [Citrobacter freundii]|uniref:Uncharacterized protein n=1 Tax=Citrobacter freundii TaxID=546 RepID=A0AAE7GQ29_CITFR|nr:hypothetical protein [Citrobacter freundii]QLO12467.1 hypothetical protein HV183_02930 [Citrobacter freundii]
MLSELAFNDDFIDLPPPAKEQLRKHARFLRNHCGVPLGHAQEMVAWFFHFKNWGDLAARQIQKTDEAARIKLAEIQESLQLHRNNIPHTELAELSALNALVGTLTEAVVSNRISQLNQHDIVLLHRYLYDHEYWGVSVPVSWCNALQRADRCPILLAKRMSAEGKIRRVNPHLYFPWFGLRMYGYLEVKGAELNYDCTELDSYLFPTVNRLDALFRREWFVPYFVGFASYLLQTLAQSGYSGRLSFSRVHNEGLIEKAVSGVLNKKFQYKRYSLNGNDLTDGPIEKLVTTLLAMGGSINPARQRIEFSFGKEGATE